MDEQFKNESRQRSRDLRLDINRYGERLTRFGRDTTIHEFDRLSSALHSAADKLHGDNGYFADVFDTLADTADNASQFLRERNPGELLGKFKDFSRQNPYITAGGLFVAGFALSRFLKTGTTEKPQYEEGNYEHGA